MNIKVLKSKIIPYLSQAQAVVDKKTNSPQLTHIYLKAENHGLSLYATDLEVSFVAHVEAQVIQPGVAVVHAQRFYEVIRELIDKPIQLIAGPNHWLEIQQDRFRSKIKGLPPEEYPLFVLNLPQTWIQYPRSGLKTLISKTEYAMGIDTVRKHLAGLYFEQEDDHLVVVGSDGHRLSMARLKTTNDKVGLSQQGIIIPRKGIFEIKRVLDETDEDLVNMNTDKTQVFLKTERITLGIRLLEGRFPNYKVLIPKNDFIAKCKKDELVTAVKRVSLFSSYKSKAITLTFLPEMIKIHTQSSDYGDAIDEITAEFNGSEVTATFNPSYLLEAIQNIDSNEAEIQISSAEKPTLFKSKKDENYLAIVMPMKV